MSHTIISISEESKRLLEVIVREKFDKTEWLYAGKYIDLAEDLGLDSLVVEMKLDEINQ